MIYNFLGALICDGYLDGLLNLLMMIMGEGDSAIGVIRLGVFISWW